MSLLWFLLIGLIAGWLAGRGNSWPDWISVNGPFRSHHTHLHRPAHQTSLTETTTSQSRSDTGAGAHPFGELNGLDTDFKTGRAGIPSAGPCRFNEVGEKPLRAAD